MNPVAQKLLQLIRTHTVLPLKFRELGRMIGDEHPQKVKYHLQKLADGGWIDLTDTEVLYKKEENIEHISSVLIDIPVYGSANCGPATLFADDTSEGKIRVSSQFLQFKSQSNVIALQADGDSMNQADISGVSIDDGDYVLVDISDRTAKNGDYIVSTIEGCANIKRFYLDERNNQVHLVSESTFTYPPIILSEGDNVSIIGKVFEVIKQQGNRGW